MDAMTAIMTEWWNETGLGSVRENVCNLSKNVKSHVFWIFKKVKKKF